MNTKNILLLAVMRLKCKHLTLFLRQGDGDLHSAKKKKEHNKLNNKNKQTKIQTEHKIIDG